MQYKVTTPNGPLSIDGAPDTCPFCHRGIRPTPVFGNNTNTNGMWVVLMNCPNATCQESFLAYYYAVEKQIHHSHAVKYPTYSGRTTVGNLSGRNFSEAILNVSSEFGKIYNEAYAAEQQGLLEICGVGYRKSIEFLIKDYIIRKQPDKQDEVEKKLLAKCIADYVTDEKIKSVAKRAVWLGNDETHFVRKWEGKNLGDMKKLIDLTLHWIEAEVLTESFEEDMPD
jgi:hypothetical protein